MGGMLVFAPGSGGKSSGLKGPWTAFATALGPVTGVPGNAEPALAFSFGTEPATGTGVPGTAGSLALSGRAEVEVPDPAAALAASLGMGGTGGFTRRALA